MEGPVQRPAKRVARAGRHRHGRCRLPPGPPKKKINDFDLDEIYGSDRRPLLSRRHPRASGASHVLHELKRCLGLSDYLSL